MSIQISSAWCAPLRLHFPAQEGHRAVGANSKEGHKDDQKDGSPLLRGKIYRVGVAQSGEGKAAG